MSEVMSRQVKVPSCEDTSSELIRNDIDGKFLQCNLNYS